MHFISRRGSQIALLVYAACILSFAVPLFSSFGRVTLTASLFLALHVIVPSLYYAFVAICCLRPARPARATTVPVRLVAALAVPYILTECWMVVDAVIEKEPRLLSWILAFLTAIVATGASLAFADLWLDHAEVPLDFARTGWLRTLRRRVGNSVASARTAVLVVGTILIVVCLSDHQTRDFLLDRERWIAALEGVGSASKIGAALENVLGYALTLGGVVLAAVALAWLIVPPFRRLVTGSPRTRACAAWTATSLASMILADFYFGWLYVLTFGSLSSAQAHHPAWLWTMTALAVLNVVSVPVAGLVCATRSAECDFRKARELVLLFFAPQLFYNFLMLPALSEAFEIRGPAALQLGLQLLSWGYMTAATGQKVDRAAAA